MLARDYVDMDIKDLEDGWYELDEDGIESVWVEGGYVVRGTAPDVNRSPVATWPYALMDDGRTWTSATCVTLADVVSGRIRMM